MIELVLTACSIVQGAQCKNETMTFLAENVTPWACMHYGQQEIAKWSLEHPNWRVARWTCGPRRLTEKA